MPRWPPWPLPRRAAPGSRAAALARPRAPRRDRDGAAGERAFDHGRDGTRSHTPAVSPVPKPPPWTSAGTRYIDDASAERPIVPAALDPPPGRAGSTSCPRPDPARARGRIHLAPALDPPAKVAPDPASAARPLHEPPGHDPAAGWIHLRAPL